MIVRSISRISSLGARRDRRVEDAPHRCFVTVGAMGLTFHRRGEGENFELGGSAISLADGTNGTFFLSETTLEAGFVGPALHIHGEMHDMTSRDTISLAESELGAVRFPRARRPESTKTLSESDRVPIIPQSSAPAGSEEGPCQVRRARRIAATGRNVRNSSIVARTPSVVLTIVTPTCMPTEKDTAPAVEAAPASA